MVIRKMVDESILVTLGRSGSDVSVPAHAFEGMPRPLFGRATAERGGAGIRLSGSAPSFSACALPGAALPELSVTRTVRELAP